MVDEIDGPQRGHETTLRVTPVRAAVPAPERVRAVPAQRLDQPMLDRVFGPDDITTVRHEVQGVLAAARLLGDRLPQFVLAVNEVITNAVLHAGGHGRLRLTRADGSVFCTVTDSGPGIPQRFQAADETPETFDTSGRGIWLAHQLCDEVTMATGPIGTTISLRMTVSAPGDSSDPAHRTPTSG